MNLKSTEEKKELYLLNREQLRVNGLIKMHSLDENIFDFDTSLGRLKVEGKNLEMLCLDIEKGILVIKGYINKIIYLEKQKEKESFLGKIFK